MSVQAGRVVPETLASFSARRTGILAWPHGLLRFARRKPLGAIALLIVVVMVSFAVFAPQIAPHDPTARVATRYAPPGTEARDGIRLWLGSDELGRDLLARVIYGSRVALQVGLIAVGIGTVIGTLLGLLSGYFGGWIDIVIQRVMDSIMAFPGLILALLLVSVLPDDAIRGAPIIGPLASLLGKGILQTMLAIGVIMIPYTSRVVRGSVLSTKQNAYVEAARSIGAGDFRIVFRHILPNVTAPIIILAATYFSAAIIAEASLSYLGLGTQPPTPSWGNMIKGPGMDKLLSNQMMLVAPAVFLSLTVLGFNLLGDALRDVWDPKLRGR